MPQLLKPMCSVACVPHVESQCTRTRALHWHWRSRLLPPRPDAAKCLFFYVSEKRESHLQLYIKKHLGINLTKVKNLYTENYKTVVRETEEDNDKHSMHTDWKNWYC